MLIAHGRTSPWDGTLCSDRRSVTLITGVRNHEAKKIMKEKMKVGDEVRPIGGKYIADGRCSSTTVTARCPVSPPCATSDSPGPADIRCFCPGYSRERRIS